MNIHLVDGTYELFRAFYGPPSATNAAGIEIGATRGFIRSMVSLLNEPNVTHIAVAFDTEIESFRNKLFDGYKTGEGIDPELHAQFPWVERASRALGLATWSMKEFEADDGIASAAFHFKDDPQVEQVRICSPDKDMLQCIIGDKVISVDRMRSKIYNEAGATEKLGVPPKSVPDYLALVGDTADGIPGIKRWGAKSAGAVLSHYHHLENIPDSETDWTVKVRGAKSLASELKENRKDALLYRKLATLRTDAPVDREIDAVEWKGATPALRDLAIELGDERLVNRVPRWLNE